MAPQHHHQSCTDTAVHPLINSKVNRPQPLLRQGFFHDYPLVGLDPHHWGIKNLVVMRIVKGSRRYSLHRIKAMTLSLVPQVEQMNGKQVKEIAEANQDQVLSFEEAMQYPSFSYCTGLNGLVVELWENSEVISRSSLQVPYCMNSQNEDDSWNVSWGLDFPGQDISTRSCFYTIFPNGAVKCREYPKELLSASTFEPALAIALAVVSDVLQSHDWDKDVAIQAIVKKVMERVS